MNLTEEEVQKSGEKRLTGGTPAIIPEEITLTRLFVTLVALIGAVTGFVVWLLILMRWTKYNSDSNCSGLSILCVNEPSMLEKIFFVAFILVFFAVVTYLHHAEVKSDQIPK